MTATQKTPAHLWIVGILSLLWNSGGAYDYTMSQMRNEEYLAMAGIPVADMLAWIDSFPAWAHAAWALGVWGAIAGSVLLLMRSRHAKTAFALSLVGIFVSAFAQHVVVDMPAALQSAGANAFSAAIILIGVGLLYYSKKQIESGVLR